MAYILSDEKRQEYRDSSLKSSERRRQALEQKVLTPLHNINIPRLNTSELMPQLQSNEYKSLSMFSGGGGLDLGFDRAGYRHVASYDILDICGKTLKKNRSDWAVFTGEAGDVRSVNWSEYRGEVDVVHGGPPCQPFSIAGNQKGEQDERNMWPSFVEAVNHIRPRAFLAENVPGLLNPKFSTFVRDNIEKPLGSLYHIHKFIASADDFGVPQIRRRVIFVGFLNESDYLRFKAPFPTHSLDLGLDFGFSRCMGAREALGLSDIGFDCFAPTLRSGFTGPRNTTGVVNSKASLETWNKLQIWPNGVQATRERASLYPPENGHFRLSVQDCAIIQGFPDDWIFEGPVYKVLGQIGNSVCPPLAYNLAKEIAISMGVDY